MRTTRDKGLHCARVELFNPIGALLSLFKGFEQDPAELLDIMLGEGVMLVPLEAFEQPTGVDRLCIQLQFHKNLLQLIRDTITGLNLFLIVAAWAQVYIYL